MRSRVSSSRPGNRGSCGAGSGRSGTGRIRPRSFRFDRANEAGVGTRAGCPSHSGHVGFRNGGADMDKKVEVFGSHEANTLDQLHDVASRAERAALMADGQLGYVMPIGGVAAYRDKVSVVGVGFDIACGNAAIRTDLTRPEL